MAPGIVSGELRAWGDGYCYPEMLQQPNCAVVEWI
jgi:hypothetical protein